MNNPDHFFSNKNRTIQDFWSKFNKNYWHRKAGKFKGLLPKSLLTDVEILRGITTAGTRVKIYVGGNEYLGDPLPFFPKRNETTLDEYLNRLKRTFAPQDFAVTVVNFNVDLGMQRFRQFRALTDGLYSSIGIPYGGSGSNLNLFLGNYKTTPVGMHKDAESTFVVPIFGRKKMRVWPAKVFDGLLPRNGFLFKYQKFNSKSKLLSGVPGDVLFWPSSYWHVGEGNNTGQVFGSLHFSINDAGNMGAWTRAKLSKHLFNSLHGYTFPNQSLNTKQIEFFTAKIETALFRQHSTGELNRNIQRELLLFQSAFGFNLVPPMPKDSEDISKNATLVLVGSQRIIAKSFAKKSIEVFAAGHSVRVRTNAPAVVQKLIRELNAKGKISLQDTEVIKLRSTIKRELFSFLIKTCCLAESPAISTSGVSPTQNKKGKI